MVRNLVSDPAITSISFWSDNGKHFHSNKFLYFPLVELVNDSDLGITDVDVNFFAPYHGKNPVDQHFAKISYWVAKYSMEWMEGIMNTKDVIKAIRVGNEIAEKYFDPHRRKRNKDKDRVVITMPLNCDVDEIEGEGMEPHLAEQLLKRSTLEATDFDA